MNLDTQIYNLAKTNGFTDQAARLVVAQARLESFNYTSNVFINLNNIFGMKYLGTRQPLATRGTLAPFKERSAPCKINVQNCINIDFYAKYANHLDSAKDLITRLYAITRNGVTPEMLKNADTPEKFANLLKRRNYYGVTESQYSAGLKARLKKIVIQSGTGLITPINILIPILFFLAFKSIKK